MKLSFTRTHIPTQGVTTGEFNETAPGFHFGQSDESAIRAGQKLIAHWNRQQRDTWVYELKIEDRTTA